MNWLKREFQLSQWFRILKTLWNCFINKLNQIPVTDYIYIMDQKLAEVANSKESLYYDNSPYRIKGLKYLPKYSRC